MEAMVKKFHFNNDQNLDIPFIEKRNDFDVNIAGFSYNFLKNQYKLSIYSDLILKDNYTISLDDDKLIIIIAEIREYNKPAYIHNFQRNYSQTDTYERIRSMDIYLPGKDFYLVRHYAIPKKSMLYVILSTLK